MTDYHTRIIAMFNAGDDAYSNPIPASQFMAETVAQARTIFERKEMYRTIQNLKNAGTLVETTMPYGASTIPAYVCDFSKGRVV